MADRIFPLNRREFMAGLGSAVLGPTIARRREGRPSLVLQAKADVIALRPGAPDTPIWSLGGSTSDPALRFKRGDAIEVALANELPVPAALNWRGIDGVPAAEPLVGNDASGAWGQANLRDPAAPCRHVPVRPAAAWRRSGATVFGAGADRRGERGRYRRSRRGVSDRGLDGYAPTEPRSRPASIQRMRRRFTPSTGARRWIFPSAPMNACGLRFINGFQRNVIAVKFEGQEVRVMALDGQPSEPFPARNGARGAGAGSPDRRFHRCDRASGLDLTHSPARRQGGPPDRPAGRLKGAADPQRAARHGTTAAIQRPAGPTGPQERAADRFDARWTRKPNGWHPRPSRPQPGPCSAPKPAGPWCWPWPIAPISPTVFHLHGHHFRLLDRLDDGWKPFWLDTLAIEAGQTQRIAFSAEYAGRWLMESTATDWAAPRLVRWYSVE